MKSNYIVTKKQQNLLTEDTKPMST